MKIFLSIVFSIICITSNALNFTIVNSSFTDNVPIKIDDNSWIDVRGEGSYGTQNIVIILSHINSSGIKSNSKTILDAPYYAVNIAPFNGDGSKRFQLNIPNDFPFGKFIIEIGQKLGSSPVTIDDDIYGFYNIGDRAVSITSSIYGEEGSTIELTYSLSIGNGNANWTIIEHTGTAFISGNTLNLSNPGTVELILEIESDENYNSTSTSQIITIHPKTVTGIINPLTETNLKITYYTIQGLKVEKPTEGLYIWKSENGDNGKIYIVRPL